VKRSKSQKYYDELRQINPELSGMVNWLNGYQWTWFCTFTTRREMTLKSARRVMERYHNLVKTLNKGATLFWVAEPHELKDGYHLHGLLMCNEWNPKKRHKVHRSTSPEDNQIKELYLQNQFLNAKDSWHKVNGLTGKDSWVTLKKYDAKIGAVGYCSKYILKERSDWDILV